MDKSTSNRAKKTDSGLHKIDSDLYKVASDLQTVGYSSTFKAADVFDTVAGVYSSDETVYLFPEKPA